MRQKQRILIVSLNMIFITLSSLSCTMSLMAAPSPTSTTTPQIQGGNENLIESPFKEIDKRLSESLQSSLVYNSPTTMKLGEVRAIQLLLNPAKTEEELAGEITESGPIVTAMVEITPRMTVELIPQDPDAFLIQPVHMSPEQLVSSIDTTTWSWFITAKKGGVQVLKMVIYRLVKYDGQDYWREVETYSSNITVDVTVVQRIQAIDWKWFVGIFITALLIPAFWRWIDSHKKDGAGQPIVKVGKTSKPVTRKENIKRNKN